MAEYASKGVAGTALGLGIAGTVGLVNQLGNCGGCGNGLLGGLFGGNNCCNRGVGGMAEVQYVSALQAENGQLKAENYSDRTSLEAYKQTVADNKELRTEMYAFIKPLSEEAANNRVTIARLEEQLKCCCEKQELREQILMGKIGEVAQAANCGLARANDEIACLRNTVCRITQTIVPASAICPQPMPQYNSWTAPTGTPTQVNVSGTVNTRSATCVG
jgi:hypothetical protein